MKEGGDTVLESRTSHVSDTPRSGVGTSSVVASSEQCAEQVEVYEGVYGPWVVVARGKNGTKQMKSGRTSPKQSNGFNPRDNLFAEKGSLDRTGVLHGPTREAKRKLSTPFLLDKAQIASVVQSLRSEGQKQAHSSPILNFNNDGTNLNSVRPLSTQNNQRLSSVKGKKGAARNRFSFGVWRTKQRHPGSVLKLRHS